MNITPRLFRYWGKAGEPHEWHPLIYHQLDVAATGILLMEKSPAIRNRLVKLSGMTVDEFSTWLAFFLAIHDLGKFSSAFQQLRKDLCPPASQEYFYLIRHDTLGHVAWREEFACNEALQARLATWSGDEDPIELLDTWVQCVTGHHGKPPEPKNPPFTDYFSQDDRAAMHEWVTIAANLFLPDPPSQPTLVLSALEDRRASFSWFLAGLSVLADWLGSNQAHFPYMTDPLDPITYFRKRALPQARRAVAESGLLPVRPSDFSGISSLFDFIESPTPLQAACFDVPLDDGPQLHILEDVTGAGKTEAAFILLARLMAACHAEGAYIALPTMATANSMYERTAKVYHKLYREEAHFPSLILAHGSRNLNPRFNDSLIHPDRLTAEGEYDKSEFDAEARCNSWLADNNKKALLAHLGVGTIDQALLGVLQSRHQSLRLLGLIGKVLIVDEVHASDAYMHTLLCQLLKLHAQADGSTILLSATLSGSMRDELIQAFGGNLDNDDTRPEDVAYPLLTSVTPSASPSYQPVATRESVRRHLDIRPFSDPDQVQDWIIEQADQGRCVAWVRNTVNDAIEAWTSLEAALGEHRVTLFHARFAMGDRLDIEQAVRSAFGPHSSADSRRGRVVIATQVIEQSLDLDFDEMVSDLAPVDLLIQRAGRLKRHRRNTDGNRLDGEGPDQRNPPCLHILSPEPNPDADERWIRRLLPGTAAVYPDHGQLWLTARELTDRRQIKVPDDLRQLIEAVYGETGKERIPEPLRYSSSQAEGKAYSDRSVARLNAIKIASGYTRRDGQWVDESLTPTRLGEPSMTIRLARSVHGGIRPWREESGHQGWALSECRIAQKWIDKLPSPSPEMCVAIEAEKEKWPRATRHFPVLIIDVPPKPDEPLDSEPDSWIYTKKLGLKLPARSKA